MTVKEELPKKYSAFLSAAHPKLIECQRELTETLFNMIAPPLTDSDIEEASTNSEIQDPSIMCWLVEDAVKSGEGFKFQTTKDVMHVDW